jgi:plastocyanin
MRSTGSALVAAVLLAFAVAACSSDPSAPTPVRENGGGNFTTINILGNDGSGAFYPSPVGAAQGSSIVWTNTDSETHHIVATDGSFDTGELIPGGTSSLIVLATNGAHYYCTLHTNERGVINASNGFPPPCTGQYC